MSAAIGALVGIVYTMFFVPGIGLYQFLLIVLVILPALALASLSVVGISFPAGDVFAVWYFVIANGIAYGAVGWLTWPAIQQLKVRGDGKWWQGVFRSRR